MQMSDKNLCHSFGEVLDYLRLLMAAEVKESPLEPPFLFGMDEKELQIKSHESGFVLPSYLHGVLAGRINKLRTKVRELELFAVKVFSTETENNPLHGDKINRSDIVLGLNRLSSALWYLFCESINEHRQ